MSVTTLIGILGLAAIAACWSLAVVLYRVGTPGSAARKLSGLLIAEGVCLVTAGFPEYVIGMDPADKFYEAFPVFGALSGIVHHAGDAFILAFYPAFLALALRTPLTRRFGRRPLSVVLPCIAVLLFAGTVIGMAAAGSYVPATFLYMAMALVFLFALIASLHAWKTSPPGAVRNRARIFAIAFGIRDICWFVVYGVAIWLTWTGSYTTMTTNLEWSMKTLYALGTLLAVPLIAYGILRAKLFDIDLRIRWTIKQSTVAGLALAIIFLVSEGVAEVLSDEIGTVAGLLAAATIIFFLAPLQQFAERVASRAMPNTENTPQYISFRKLQVYEAALAEALEDGDISKKERTLLQHLATSLDISEADAKAIEADLRSGNVGGADMAAGLG